jgi:hypothetical protein
MQLQKYQYSYQAFQTRKDKNLTSLSKHKQHDNQIFQEEMLLFLFLTMLRKEATMTEYPVIDLEHNCMPRQFTC